MQETWVWSLGQEVPLEKGMAIHSSVFAWKIPLTEESSGLQSMGSQWVGRDWSTERPQRPKNRKEIQKEKNEVGEIHWFQNVCKVAVTEYSVFWYK